MTTRRGMTTRGHNRLNSSAAVASTDELGVLGEGATEVDVLRRDLEVSERENNRLKDQILSLQAMLSQRPSAEELRSAKETVKNVELLLAGANRENEKAMMETDRANRRIKILEEELSRLVGPSWQNTLELAPDQSSIEVLERPSMDSSTAGVAAPTVTSAYLEQMRLLIIGMETHLQTREEELEKTVNVAKEKERQLVALKKAELVS